MTERSEVTSTLRHSAKLLICFLIVAILLAFPILLSPLPIPYGTSVVILVILAIMVVLYYLKAEDSTYTRLVTGLVLLAIAAYVADALGLQHAMGTEINILNIQNLPPASMHPFVHGLRLFPAYALILAYWVSMDLVGNVGFDTRRDLGKLYLVLLAVFIALDCWAMWTFDGLGTAVVNAIPQSFTQLTLYGLVMATNGLVGVLVFMHWRKKRVIREFRYVFVVCVIGALLIVVIGENVNRISNQMSKCCLDHRRPQAYRGGQEDPGKCAEFVNDLNSGKPNPFRGYLTSTEFATAYSDRIFYKWSWDEPFQPPWRRAVNLGFRREPTDHFTLMRMPFEVFECLRFEPLPDRYPKGDRR